MKKITAFLLALFLMPGIALAEGTPAPVRVCALFSGHLGDQSYNDAVYEGALRASAEIGCELTALEGDSASDWEANFLAAVDSGYDLILCASPSFAEYVKERAPANLQMKFAVIDAQVSGGNVACARFASTEGAFLAGAAAAILTSRTNLPGINDLKVIGWIGGMDTPSERALYAGFEQGARYIAPGIRVFQSFTESWSDVQSGSELAQSQFELGADVVMNAAGGAGLGIPEIAKARGGYVIGCNVDQDGDAPGTVFTSLVRRLDEASYRLIESAALGTGEANLSFDLENGGVCLTDMAVFQEALGDAFPADILETLSVLREQILLGEIEVVTGDDPE